MIKLPVKIFIFSSFLFFLSACNSKQKTRSKETASEKETVFEPSYLYNICIDSLCIHEGAIRKNQTLSQLLNNFGINNNLINAIIQKSKDIIDVRKINAGKIYTAILCNDSLNLHYLVYKENSIDYVVFNLKDTLVYRESKPMKTTQRTIHAGIDKSLWETIKKLNTSQLLSIKLSEIYESQIDFFEITPADSFSVVFDEIFVDDTLLIDIGTIHAAVFKHKGKDNYAFAFYQDNELNYYDEKADNMKRAFLKAPLKYSRISSRFSNSRYHPVLKIYRPHHGIDYSAPTGTPVFALGAGTVVKKAYQKKGGGNFITIKHPNGYKTTYMHLHGFSKGMAVGKRVAQGELIGYVGSTGLSTGPHLDFRVYKNNRPVNPLTIVSPPLEPLREELKDSFMVVRNERMKELRGK